MKSPGGSIFPYYYKGGEIHCLKYGSKHKDQDKLFDVMRQEEAFIFGINKKLKVWVDMYETKITKEVLDQLICNINNLKDHVDKLSFVGLSGMDRWKLKRRLKSLELGQSVSFYADPEEAKTWLITDR
ncbi:MULTISPECIES: hypothetical protein [Paenibacillus]|uniref:SpoIIAA-like protein n=1 Tax=Paenibacillus pabuli TaxID=1472 RepID=A0A855Y745_9BACL|nr:MULTISPECIES: hypothetical protein [Paenibacillus]PWW40790.1 hypothetical protein DET56_10562 [Paenibacillus pabuli]PXW11914.1 hypothetical protein DEU73_101785 [Paenibacillus taichungensis]RAI97368.1 hypothetical protein DET54_105332 [Paenibacillus pabuli]SEL89796.1 hypothetical protein SAMN05518856_12278 [Paenibacillus sp. OK003]